MKKIFLLLVAALVGTTAWSQKRTDLPVQQDSLKMHTMYSCPMHPDIVSSQPGKCTKCHMDLVANSKDKMKADVTGAFVCPMHAEVLSDHSGICAKCKSSLVANRTGSKGTLSTYSCSMHKDVVSNESGKCPVCGMALVDKKN
jgi:putative DNA topoisomerase